MSDLHLDAEKHIYTWGDVLLPGVTDVLGDMIPGFRAGKYYLQRGTTVHACAAMIARGQEFELDLSNQSQEDANDIRGRIAALRRFFREVNPTVISCETPMMSTRYRFAGTPDLIASLANKSMKIVFDWKASLSAAVPFQLAAYGILADVDNGCPVEIQPSGKYKMGKIIPLKLYKTKFLNLLSAFNIRRECGVPFDAE